MVEKRVFVKNISNLSDARYCAGMGVEFISFNIDKEEGFFVEPLKIKEISGWLAGIKIILETNNFDLEIINTIKEKVEISGFLTKNQSIIENLSAINSNVFFELNDEAIPLSIPKSVSNLIIETNGSNLTFLKEIEKNAENIHIFIGYQLNTESIGIIKNQFPDFGFALMGSEEIRPGFKNYDSMVNTLELLDED